MPLVTVQLGQCGNQVGCELFNCLSHDVHDAGNDGASIGAHQPARTAHQQLDEYVELSQDRFFSVNSKGIRTARAVLVDMECKVVGQMSALAQRSGLWQYNKKHQYVQKQGSGNNWARGYCTYGGTVRDSVMDMVRKEVERCDLFEGFLTLLSLAGGTGSGLGAYINECLHDEYPNAFILNQVVWPYHLGEVIVQNYNAVLTLSHLYDSSDSIIVVQNDHIHRICTQRLNIKQVQFSDINKVIAQQLTSVLQPAREGLHGAPQPEGQGAHYITNHLGSLIEQCTPHPQYKLVNVLGIPHTAAQAQQYSTYTWPALLKTLTQMLKTGNNLEEGMDWSIKSSIDPGFNRSLCNLLLLRGRGINASINTSSFSDAGLYSSTVPIGERYTTWSNNRPINGYDMSAVVLTNSQALSRPLDNVVEKAWQMFASKAYMHQYMKHGLSEDDFVDNFVSLEQVIHNYRQL